MSSTANAFTQNRAEELGLDVWREFVIPRFYRKLDLEESNKPKVIEGGRGCGKTMLLRYRSYHSQFSPHRQSLELSDISKIGIYWKADTQFLRMMTSRGIEIDKWADVFTSFLQLKLLGEAFSAISTLKNKLGDKILTNIEDLQLPGISAHLTEEKSTFASLKETLSYRKKEIDLAIANPQKRLELLTIFPPNTFREGCEELTRKIPELKEVVFHVYIDEYENLHEYQQEVVNTCIKHSDLPAVYNIAMKKHGMCTINTRGREEGEKIVETHDFRTIDIDDETREDMRIFAAEILLSRLASKTDKDLPIDASVLRDINFLKIRNSDDHKKKITQFAEKLLPGYSKKELAEKALRDKTVLAQALNQIEKGLNFKKSSNKPQIFIDHDFPEASIVNCALINRPSISEESLLAEFEKLKSGQRNKYSGATDWIKNNFYGCLLRLYNPLIKVCPIYGGYDSFLTMSRGNLRHFLELVHSSLKEADQETYNEQLIISVESQAKAARKTAELFIKDIEAFGKNGKALMNFALELGYLFGLSQKRDTQSEPEINHITIIDESDLNPEIIELFNEAEKWSVIFKERSTKHKSEDNEASSKYDYILNPIYSPYFLISFIKRRSVGLTSSEARTLFLGSTSERKDLRSRYRNKWSVERTNTEKTKQGMLFRDD